MSARIGSALMRTQHSDDPTLAALLLSGLPARRSPLRQTAASAGIAPPSVEVQAADITPPVTTISGTGVNAGWVSRTSVTFSLTARDTGGSGVDETLWRLNKTGAFTVGTRGTVTAEGTTTVEYYSIDNASNVEASKVATIQIDRSRPTLSSDRMPYYPSAAVIRVNATDTVSGVASMAYRLDGAHLVSVNATTSIAVGPVGSAGTHTLVVSATDRAGNTASTTLTFTVGPTAPTTRITFVPPRYVQNTWSSSPVTFTLAATAPTYPFSIAGTRYRVDGSSLATYTAPCRGRHRRHAHGRVLVGGRRRQQGNDEDGHDQGRHVASDELRAMRPRPTTLGDHHYLSATDPFSGVALGALVARRSRDDTPARA